MFRLLVIFLAFITASAVVPIVMNQPQYPNPLKNSRLALNYNSASLEWLKKSGSSDLATAARIKIIADEPQAIWFTETSPDFTYEVNSVLASSTAEGTLPVLVAYNIPHRDCNGYSHGGASDAHAYKTWIDTFLTSLQHHRAVVILEPDALADLDCLNTAQQQERLDLLSYAVTSLSVLPNVYVYIDAGNPLWQPANVMSARLKQVHIDSAQGFSLNVSNYFSTNDVINYGLKISKSVKKNFVIDTSRNGKGPNVNYEWCNPHGRGIGLFPTTTPNTAFVDAFLWIKDPGASDGECNGGPAAGQFSIDLSKDLLYNSGY